MYLDDLYHHLKGTNTGAVRRLWIKLRLKERVVLAEPISFIHISLCTYIYIYMHTYIDMKWSRIKKSHTHLYVYIYAYIYIHICILVESCRCLSVFHCQRTLYILQCIYIHTHTLFSIYLYRDIVACFWPLMGGKCGETFRQDHAVLLCCALQGLKKDAWVCIGHGGGMAAECSWTFDQWLLC